MPATDDALQETAAIADHLPLEVAVELGRVQFAAAHVLGLGVGDVLTLDRPVGDVVDLRVGGHLLARGELVDVDGEAGVRLTEVFDGD